MEHLNVVEAAFIPESYEWVMYNIQGALRTVAFASNRVVKVVA
jgi:hypothetical protein